MTMQAQAQTQTVQSVIQHWANFYGIPDWIALAIAQAESALDPNAKGDYNAQGQPTSFGLFQLHIGGGQGDGFTPQQLLNPDLNSQIAIAHMVGPYQQGVAQGLSGYDLLQYVAAHSGHPDETGQMPADYAKKLAAAYQAVTGKPPSSSSGSGGSTSGQVQIETPSGIGGWITRIFWGSAGIAVVLLGIWLMFNPFANLQDAASKIASAFKSKDAGKVG